MHIIAGEGLDQSGWPKPWEITLNITKLGPVQWSETYVCRIRPEKGGPEQSNEDEKK